MSTGNGSNRFFRNIKLLLIDELHNTFKHSGSAIFTENLSRALKQRDPSLLIDTVSFCNTVFKKIDFILKFPFLRELFIFPFYGIYVFLSPRFKSFNILQFSSVTTAFFSFLLKRKRIMIIVIHCLFSRQIPVLATISDWKLKILFNCFTQWLFILAERISFWGADVVIVPKSNILEYLKQNHKLTTKKILMIPQGIRREQFYSGEKPNGKTILFVGRASKMKSFSTFVKLARLMPEYNFVAVCHELPTSNSWPKNLIFKVNVRNNQIASIYRQAKVLVMPSLSETGPIVTLEALTTGVPVIASPEGAGEFVRDGENGYIVYDNSVEGYHEKLKGLLSDEASYDKMSQMAMQSTARYDFQYIAERYLSLYYSISHKSRDMSM